MLDDVFLSPIGVAGSLTALNGLSTAGLDGFHPYMLKAFSEALSLSSYLLFVRSFNKGALPTLWKTSIVSPLFKSGNRCDPLNYRPVSLTSVCCKDLEWIIVSQLMNYLESNGLLPMHQFAFYKSRSLEDQLLVIYVEVVDAVDKGLTVDMVYLDISKELNVVSNFILEKLEMLGVCGKLLVWIHEFLFGRTNECHGCKVHE